MNLKYYITNQLVKNTVVHLLVIAILIVNMLFFTLSTNSMIIQGILLIAILIHHRDDYNLINHLKYAEERLREDTKIFDRNLIVSESDLNGVFTYANEKFCEITGYTQEELIGKPHSILRHPDEPKDFYKNLWETIKNKDVFHAEFKNLKKDGSVFWADTAISPIINNEKIVGYKSIRFDVTSDKLDKENLISEIDIKDYKLQEQSTRFEFAINSSRDGFWDYDLISKEFFLSSSWRKRLGFSKGEKLKYLDYLALIPDENRFKHHTAMHNALEIYRSDIEYVHFKIRYPLIAKSGEKLFVEDVGDIFFDKDRIPIRITGFHRDITDEERQAKIIESQNRFSAMGEMMGNIAHQWRQPLGAITSTINDIEFYIELEEKSEVDAKLVLKTFSKVKEYTDFMNKTINDFRNMASDDKAITEFRIVSVVNEAYSIVKNEFNKNHIEFEITEYSEVNRSVFGYQRELLQVIINILNNAKDALIAKNIKNSMVSVGITQEKKDTSIVIHDNAGGVPDSIIEKIFDPYFTTKHQSSGTGIGLYMSYKIITQDFKGKLIVENENNGAKFTIIIPN